VSGRAPLRPFTIALALLALLAGACLRLPPRAPQPTRASASQATLLAALAERERGTDGLRLSMQVRVSGAAATTFLPSPAYLAVDQPDRIRLQVLSAFGVTVLDLTIAGPRYELVMPLRNRRAEGRVDLAALADAGDPGPDRMILALALLFRHKIDPLACALTPEADVRCTMEGGVIARTTVDDALRPVREEYARADGSALVTATFADYDADGPQALPGHITIADPASGTTLSARVLRARRVAHDAAGPGSVAGPP
jgi:hypothetical protein